MGAMDGELGPDPRRPGRARPSSSARGAGGNDVGRLRWADDAPRDSADARNRIVDAALECVRLYGADIALDVLLREAADLVVDKLRAALGNVIESAIEADLRTALRPVDLDQ